jgi:hypothetical protein
MTPVGVLKRNNSKKTSSTNEVRYFMHTQTATISDIVIRFNNSRRFSLTAVRNHQE